MDERRPDTPLGLLLRALWDMLLLNLLWILCSIPVVTMGTASSSVYSVLLRRDRSGELPVVKNYFKSFLRDFVSSLLLFVTGVVMGLAAWADINFAMTFDGAAKLVYLILGCLLTLGCLIVLFAAIPLQAYGKNTYVGYLKNALYLVLGFPGQFVLILLVWAIPVGIVLLLPLETVIRIGVLYLMWGFSGPAFFTSKIYNKIFDKISLRDNN